MLTEEQIQFLNRSCFNRWKEINGIINCTNLYIDNEISVQIPVQFGICKKNCSIVANHFVNLLGCPSTVTGSFNCHSNDITSLEGGPKEIHEYYSCESNLLINLNGAPEICNANFYCNSNQLTSLEGCPKLIRGRFNCEDNPTLYILYGLGRVESMVEYDAHNDLNEWIIMQAKRDVFLTYADISKWIKDNNKFEFLLYAQPQIRQYFSPRIIYLVDSGIYNESRILNYKNFSH